MGGSAASAFCKSCNCNSSIATRVGFGLIFALSSMLAYISRTDLAIRQIEKLSFDWIKMDCSGGKCYGLLAVHRFCFALVVLHAILSLSLIGVRSTKDKRAAVQNGWWGLKLLLYFVLAFLTFLIPNEFFMAYGSYISPIGAFFFILIGLVLLVDFAHTWSETCLDKWESTESNLWQFILVGSTLGMYAASLALTIILYIFFAGSGCGLNTFFITLNLILAIAATVLSIAPPVQEANPKSGLAQASMVTAYTTYLTASAVANHNDSSHGTCNPLHTAGTKTTTVIVGAAFTFLAIAYSTSRAATQSKALVGNNNKRAKSTGAIALPEDNEADVAMIANEPRARKNPMRYEAIKAAVDAGALPASALDEPDSDDEEDEEPIGEDRDDERSGTKYNYSWFHVIFILAAMYVGGLLTDWKVVSTDPSVGNGSSTTSGGDDQDVFIGRSEAAMWMRVISSWICIVIYSWSL